MKRIVILLFLSLSLVAFGQKGTPTDQSKYLSGAVPVVDGKVVFTKSFNIASMLNDSVFVFMDKWVNQTIAKKGNSSRIVSCDASKGELIALIEEIIVFKQTIFSVDRTTINYFLRVKISDTQCIVSIDDIKYLYNQAQSDKQDLIRAEGWITDDYAMNKERTKLVYPADKFRVKTIDIVSAIFDELDLDFTSKKMK